VLDVLDAFAMRRSGINLPAASSIRRRNGRGRNNRHDVRLLQSGKPAARNPGLPAGRRNRDRQDTPASVIGPTPQGIVAGNFDALVAALTSNTAYGNIHTVNFPAGEIRGQIRRDDDRD